MAPVSFLLRRTLLTSASRRAATKTRVPAFVSADLSTNTAAALSVVGASQYSGHGRFRADSSRVLPVATLCAMAATSATILERLSDREELNGWSQCCGIAGVVGSPGKLDSR